MWIVLNPHCLALCSDLFLCSPFRIRFSFFFLSKPPPFLQIFLLQTPSFETSSTFLLHLPESVPLQNLPHFSSQTPPFISFIENPSFLSRKMAPASFRCRLLERPPSQFFFFFLPPKLLHRLPFSFFYNLPTHIIFLLFFFQSHFS